jgi:hypothetical protein
VTATNIDHRGVGSFQQMLFDGWHIFDNLVKPSRLLKIVLYNNNSAQWTNAYTVRAQR